MDNEAIFIGELESHHVVLAGKEAVQYCKATQRTAECFFPDSNTTSNNETASNKAILIDALRSQFLTQHYMPDSLESIDIPKNNDIDFKLAEGWNIKHDKRNQLVSTPSILMQSNAIAWQMDLSNLSFAEAALHPDQKQPVFFELTCNKQVVRLFNAPYLLSKASLSPMQRLQLFSHLEVKVLIQLNYSNGIFNVDLVGGDGKETCFSFVGSYPEYEKIAFQHWYAQVVQDICINEPPEVKNRYA